MARSLSRKEAGLVLDLEWRDQRLVSRGEIIRTMSGDARAADKLISSLRRKNWLDRIGPGKYLLIPADRGAEGVPDMNALLLGSLVTSPYYFSYATANAFYNLTSQARREVFVACRRKLRPRLIRESMFRFVYLVSDKFFGFDDTRSFDVNVKMAEPEKAIVDSVDKPHYAGDIPELAGVIARGSLKCDWDKLISYALRMDSIVLVQRLGYLCDCVGFRISHGARKKLKKRIKKHSCAYLGAVRIWGDEGVFDREWQLIVNVPRRQITAEI
jgi:predicted transcriptional regulator of viral defense system